MLAEIITIGDEILIGQVVDTNASFIGAALTKIGVEVHQITSISDERKQILQTLEAARNRSKLVIITGGLGPTNDDLTKEVLCDFCEDHLIENTAVVQNIKELFKRYNLDLPMPANLKQAMVPSKADILMNHFGTAPGMWIRDKNTVFVALPGVPYEMRHLMEESVIPKILDEFDRSYIHYSTLLTYGMGESAIAKRLEAFENALPDDVRLAYLPALGKVRLRVSCSGLEKEEVVKKVEVWMKRLREILSDIAVGLEEETSIVKRIGDLLKSRKQFMSVAESCTGGKIAAEIIKNAGASSTFKGGVTVYETSLKTKILGVPKKLIDTFNVVSVEVAEAMATRCCRVLDSDYAIATTGIAGPDKGEGNDEVGTVCIAVASPSGVISEKFHFGNDRERVIEKSVNKGFEMLLKEILKF